MRAKRDFVPDRALPLLQVRCVEQSGWSDLLTSRASVRMRFAGIAPRCVLPLLRYRLRLPPIECGTLEIVVGSGKLIYQSSQRAGAERSLDIAMPDIQQPAYISAAPHA